MTNRNYGKCLGCYHAISDGSLYHQRCSQKLFQQKSPPHLEITAREVDQFAHKFLSQRLAVTGVQRKLSLALDKAESSRLTIVGSLGGAYIMKPPNPDYDQMPEIEDLSMHMAEACGIKTARHGLLPMQEGGLAYITKRFDRKAHKKVAVEDMCQLSGLLTEQKYRSSHEQVGKLIHRYSSVPGDDVLRFFELVIFSYVIGNNDMHLKNFSLLTDDLSFIHMTPAYDLLAVRLLLSKKEDPEDLALTLNGKKAKLKSNDFVICGRTLGIPEKVVVMVLEKQINSKSAMFDCIDRSFLTEERQASLRAFVEESLTVIAR
jgi:serine/threonine-protein kinase HipA